MCVQALIHHLNLHLLLDGKLDREQKVILQIRLTMPTSLGGSSVFEEKRQTTDSVGCWVLVFYEYPTTGDGPFGTVPEVASVSLRMKFFYTLIGCNFLKMLRTCKLSLAYRSYYRVVHSR